MLALFLSFIASEATTLVLRREFLEVVNLNAEKVVWWDEKAAECKTNGEEHLCNLAQHCSFHDVIGCWCNDPAACQQYPSPDAYGFRIEYKSNHQVSDVHFELKGERTIPTFADGLTAGGCTVQQGVPCFGGATSPWDGVLDSRSCWGYGSHSIVCDHEITSDSVEIRFVSSSSYWSPSGWTVTALDPFGNDLKVVAEVESNDQQSTSTPLERVVAEEESDQATSGSGWETDPESELVASIPADSVASVPTHMIPANLCESTPLDEWTEWDCWTIAFGDWCDNEWFEAVCAQSCCIFGSMFP